MQLTQAEIDLYRTRPHKTKLWLSVYQPDTVLACRLDNADIEQGDMTLDYDGVTEGAFGNVKYDMMMYVGTTLGGSEKGRIRVRWANADQIAVAENSHINWEDNDYLTIVDFYEILARYPRIIHDPADATKTLWYKDYDIAYINQNTINGSLICMGPHHAGFLDASDEHNVYYSASGTVHVNFDSHTGSSFHWIFEGGTPTGSTGLVPGYVTYDTPGHYTTQLSVSGSNGSADVSYRHISIYDKPDEGDNPPILLWNLLKLGGSRGSGGYTASIRIDQEIPMEDLRDGSLVVIFAEDWYGDTKQSIGGNATNRDNIVFVGYVADGTIRFNYRNNTVEFVIVSPNEIMKLCDSFSASIEDIDDPVARNAAQPGQYPSPWALMVELDVQKALYHYLRWHSTVLKCCDFQFLGVDQKIQYADFDRESLYSAVKTLVQGALRGNIVSDMQGKLWSEIDAYIEQARPLTSDFALDNQDWIGEPTIDEILTDQVAFIEMGGIAYTGYTGTSTPYLSAIPGETPGYRGKIERIQGLALTSQSQLNSIAGQTYSYMNRKYPRLDFTIAGNYRRFDIAPQERYAVYIPSTQNPRGLAINEDFFVDAIGWRYDAQKEIFRPNVNFSQLPETPFAGQTTAIPETAPTAGDNGGGFEVPPFEIPPFDLPPIAVPDLGYIFIPALGGNTIARVRQTWHDAVITQDTNPHGVPIRSVGDSAGGMNIVPLGVSKLELYPLLRVTTPIPVSTTEIHFEASIHPFNDSGASDFDSNTSTETYNLVLGFNWLTDSSFTLNTSAGDVIRCYIENLTNNAGANISCYGFIGVVK